MAGCRFGLQTNIQDLRRHLEFTERELQELKQLETDSDQDREAASVDPSVIPLTLADLSPETPDLTPIRPRPKPRAIASSTPKKSKMATSRELKVARELLSGEESYSSHGSSSHSNRGREHTFTSQDLSGLPADAEDDENMELRRKLKSQRSLNADLTSQNHELLNKLETVEHQHRQTKLKLSQTVTAGQDCESQLSQTQAQLSCQHQLVDSLKLSLGQAEEKATLWEQKGHQLTAALEEHAQNMEVLEEHVEALKADLAAARTEKDRCEHECLRALQAAETLQASMEDLQRKSQDQASKFQTSDVGMKTSLNRADKQHNQLVKQAQDLTEHISDLQEEIKRFEEENAAEREARMSTDQQNVELRTQIAKLTARINKSETYSAGEVGEHNVYLEQQVAQFRRNLQESRDELSDLRQKLDQALACRDSLDPSDSGLGLGASSSSLVEELRRKLADRDQQMEVLRARLETQEAYRSQALDSSSLQTQAARDSLERQTSELEALVSTLEQERGRYTSKLLGLEEQRTELELQTSALQARLDHRERESSALRQELGELNDQVVTLERKLRKSQNEASSLQRDAEDQQREKSICVARNESLQKELSEAQKELIELKTEADAIRRRLKQQGDSRQEQETEQTKKISELQSSVTQMCGEARTREDEVQKVFTDMDRVAQDLNAKEMTIADLSQELTQTRQQSAQALSDVESRASQATEKVTELQVSLSICHSELQVYIIEMDRCKTSHEQILSEKQQQVSQLQQEVSSLKQKLTSSQSAVCEAQQLLESKEQTAEEVTQLLDTRAVLQAKVSALEQELEQEQTQAGRDKKQLLADIKMLQGKLQAACVTLEEAETKLQNLLQESQDTKRHLLSARREADGLQGALEDSQVEAQQLDDQVTQLESEVKDARTSLRGQQHEVETLRESLHRTQEDLKEKTSRASELSDQLQQKTQALSDLKLELQSARNQQLSSREELSLVKQSLEERDRQLTSLNNKYRVKEESVEHKQQEMDQLYSTLQQQHWQLQQRAGQISQLDVCLRERKNETEQRLSTLEGNLKTTQLEVQQRSKQVAVLDEQTGLLKAELREKELKLEESTRLCSRQQLQLQAATENVSTLQKQAQDVKSELLSGQKEKEEMTKELEATRAEEASLQQQLTQARCELSLTQRQQENMNSQLQEAQEQSQAQKSSAVGLAELLKAQKAQLESRHGADQRQIQRELETIKLNYQQQVETLRRETSKVADSLEDQQHHLERQLQETQDRERQLVVELENTKAELGHKSQEMSVMRETLEKTCGRLQESELSGLKEEPQKPASSTYSSRMSANQNQPYIQPDKPSVLIGGAIPNPPPAQKGAPPNQPYPTLAKSHPLYSAPTQPHPFSNPPYPVPPQPHPPFSNPPYPVPLQRHPPSEAQPHPPSDPPFFSLSISDITRDGDTSSAHYVISEPDDPDSLQSMLKEVQRMTFQDQSIKDPGQTSRLFGANLWPGKGKAPEIHSQGPDCNNSKYPKPAKSKPETKTAKKLDHLKKNRGPLHSSPHQGQSPTKKLTSAAQASSKTGVHFSASSGNVSKGQRSKPLKSPDLAENSPNVSTAIGHYQQLGDVALTLFPEKEAGSTDNRPATVTQPGDLDLASRRQALETITQQLKSHLQSVDQHLATSWPASDPHPPGSTDEED